MFGGWSWSRTSTAYAAELQSVELTYAQPTQIIQLIVYVVSSQMSRTFLALARGIYKSPFGSSIIDYNLNLGKCQVFFTTQCHIQSCWWSCFLQSTLLHYSSETWLPSLSLD